MADLPYAESLRVCQVVVRRELSRIDSQNAKSKPMTVDQLPEVTRISKRGKYVRNYLPALLDELRRVCGRGTNPNFFQHDWDKKKLVGKRFNRIRARSLMYESDKKEFKHHVHGNIFDEVNLETWASLIELTPNLLKINNVFTHILVSNHLLERMWERDIAKHNLINQIGHHMYDWMKLWVVMVAVRYNVFSNDSVIMPLGDHIVIGHPTETKAKYKTASKITSDKHQFSRDTLDQPKLFLTKRNQPLNLRLVTAIEWNEMRPEQEWCNAILKLFLRKHRAVLDDALYECYCCADPWKFLETPAFQEARSDMIRIMNHQYWLQGAGLEKARYFTISHPESIYGAPVTPDIANLEISETEIKELSNSRFRNMLRVS